MICNKITCPKTELDEQLKYTIPESLELKESTLSGIGIFAKCQIPNGTIIQSNFVGKLENKNGEFRDYYWRGGNIYDGVGYFANGSCPLFEKYEEGTIIGPYVVKRINIKTEHDKEKQIPNCLIFITTRDIQPGEELILDYGNRYFMARLGKLGININKGLVQS
jgi:SET domain-containing protein